MQKILSWGLMIVFLGSFMLIVPSTSAKSSGYYYRSAKTGQFTTKNYSIKNPSTTIKQSRKR